jgi:hypothetical protein
MLTAVILTVLWGVEPSLSKAEFERLHAELQPEADAPWRTIPWRVSLLEARAEAARQKKPIFIWAMDGHPLGCT